MHYYSPSTRGFYHAELHGDSMPRDAVKITEKRHADLIAAQASGAQIVPGPKGPVARKDTASHADLIALATLRVKREARRRILGVASLERQSNDNAAIALAALARAGLSGAAFEAVERRRQIDAIRAASGAIEAELSSGSTDLASFNASAHPFWP